MATATNWILNLIVGVPCGGVGVWGAAGLFVFYALVCQCVAETLAVWWRYPEMKGLRMEQTEEVLREGWGSAAKRVD